MPEGDTVWLAVHRMHEALAGRTLTGSNFRVPRLATTNLAGHAVTEVVARGKHILTRLDNGLTLHTHFRMDGTWHLYRPGARWRLPGHQARVILTTDEWHAVGFRLPVIELLRTGAEDRVVGHLGPDLLGPDWDAAEAVRRLQEFPDRGIGPALLDQRNLAGVGNLYKAEALFLHGVSPWTRVEAVSDLPGLVDRLHELLLRNRDDWPQVTTGDTRRGRQHWVFERAGQPCRRCGERVRTARQGATGEDRITYWCARCQPGSTISGDS